MRFFALTDIARHWSRRLFAICIGRSGWWYMHSRTFNEIMFANYLPAQSTRHAYFMLYRFCRRRRRWYQFHGWRLYFGRRRTENNVVPYVWRIAAMLVNGYELRIANFCIVWWGTLVSPRLVRGGYGFCWRWRYISVVHCHRADTPRAPYNYYKIANLFCSFFFSGYGTQWLDTK